jgi:hypothetical protein
MRTHYRILSTLILIGGVLVGITSLARAQGTEPPDNFALGGSMGTAFTYQGQLKQNGSPVNQHCDFQFALYAAESGGSPIITWPANDVSVSNGLFSTQVDFGASYFTGQARWLEISVSCPTGSGIFSPLTPRQLITPTPYALYASNAWNLGGNANTTAGTNYIGTNDNQALEIWVNKTRVYRLEPNATSPNLIGGFNGNWVTAGTYGATIGGGGASGNLNRVTDSYGTVSGGYNNQAGDNSGTAGDKPYTTIGGGGYNTASNWFATVSGGDSNQATGDHATIGGGGANTATAYGATIPGGSGATASHTGQMAYASGRFTDNGDAQASLYILRKDTSSSGWHDLYLNGADQLLTIASDRTLTFDILIVGRCHPVYGNKLAGYQITGVIGNVDGTTAFIGTPLVTTLGENDAAWDVLVVADDTNDALRIQVNGGSNIIRWVASVRTVEVAW